MLELRNLLLGLLDRRVRRKELHLCARSHDLLDGPVAHRKHVDDHLALVLTDRVLTGDEGAELGHAHRVLLLARVAPEKPQHDVGGQAEEPDHRAQQKCDDRERTHDDARYRLSRLERDALGHELAADDGQVGDGDGHENESQGLGGGRAQPPFLERRRKNRGDLGGSERRREEAGDRHADLDGGKKTIRIRRQTRDGFARRTFLGHLVDLRLAKGNERHLRRGEQTADQREKKDEKDVFDKWIHTSIVAHPRLQPHRGTAIE